MYCLLFKVIYFLIIFAFTGHSKLKLFITHGGISSILEATYHGIPIIGMPLFADQFGNMKEAEQEGWARTLPWKELEGNKFRKMIIDTIKDKRFKFTFLRKFLFFLCFYKHSNSCKLLLINF